MLTIPSSPVPFACFAVLWAMFAIGVRAVYLTATRAWRRRRFTESVRIVPRPHSSAPRFQRDPSPTPRRRAS